MGRKPGETEAKNYTIRPEIMNEFVSIKPGALSNYGLFGIFFLVVVLLFVAKFIPYPESINFHTKIVETDAFGKSKLFICELVVPQKYFTKIVKGLPVQLRIDAYPYREFGVIKCKIDSVSVTLIDSGFTAYVLIPKLVLTTQNKFVQFKNGLKTECIIITKDNSLFDRLYNKITSKKYSGFS